MNDATAATATCISDIKETIDRVSLSATTVAGAVEEQYAVTQQINEHVSHSADGAQSISANIQSVQQAANDTGSNSEDVLKAAGELSGKAISLQTKMDEFMELLSVA